MKNNNEVLNQQNLKNIKTALDEKGFNQADEKTKHTIFEEVSTLVIKTDIYDLLGQIDDLGFSEFISESFDYGEGLRILFNDLLKVDSYDPSGKARYPQDTNRPTTREIIIKDEFKIKIRNDFKDVDYVKHFANSESMAAFIANQVKRTNDTFLVLLQQSIKRLFGEGTEKIDAPAETNLEKNIDTIKKAMINTKNVDIKKDSDFIKEVWKEIIKNTSEVNNKNNIGKGKYKDGSEADPLYNNPKPGDLLLIMNPLDILDFNWDSLPQLFNKNNTFALPEVKRLPVISVPSKTAYLIDKRAIKFIPKLDKMYSVFNEFTLETLTVRHIWMVSGFVPYVFGMKIVANKKD
ncbi:MAG: hypothetical protein E7Y34_01425 [Mycoplasma sp.]|nr:hypothetical protein [Mycoplasma sp.]